ncbi:MAG: PilN domain-containing protein [Aliidongia sp.]
MALLLRFELDRQTPFTPEQVYFDARVVERQPAVKRMVVEAMLVKRHAADQALASLRRWGLTPSRLGVQREEGWALDFQPDQISEEAFLRRHRLSAALAVITVGLAMAAWLAHQSRQDAYAVALAAELTRSRAGAEVVRAMQKELDGREGRIVFLTRRKRATSAGQLLEELAAKLPDDSWVTEFELAGKTLRLHGFSKQASALPDTLGRSALLAIVHSSAPSVLVSTGPERFDLSAELRDGSGP